MAKIFKKSKQTIERYRDFDFKNATKKIMAQKKPSEPVIVQDGSMPESMTSIEPVVLADQKIIQNMINEFENPTYEMYKRPHSTIDRFIKKRHYSKEIEGYSQFFGFSKNMIVEQLRRFLLENHKEKMIERRSKSFVVEEKNKSEIPLISVDTEKKLLEDIYNFVKSHDLLNQNKFAMIDAISEIGKEFFKRMQEFNSDGYYLYHYCKDRFLEEESLIMSLKRDGEARD